MQKIPSFSDRPFVPNKGLSQKSNKKQWQKLDPDEAADYAPSPSGSTLFAKVPALVYTAARVNMVR